MDFLPYGEQTAGGAWTTHKLTGKERDSETGLDYFGARYYSNGLGRFITPDWAAKATAVPYAVLGDPQSLNLYTYVRDIPTTNVDPDGHETNGLAHGVGDFDRQMDPIYRAIDKVLAFIGGRPTDEQLNNAQQNLQNVGDAIQHFVDQNAEYQRQQCGCGSGVYDMGNREADTKNNNNSYQKSTENKSGSGSANGGEVHGNSHATEKPAEGYTLRNKDTGEVLKYGETTQGAARYSKEYLKEHNAEMVVEAKGTKAQMHKWQHEKIVEFKNQNDGARPPLNKSDY
jgi:RHS repeat-associated protein